MTLRLLRCSRSLAFLTTLAIAPLALADGRDPRAATELFEHGRDAVKKADFATACPLFLESQRLDPKVGTLLNLADCEEHIGQVAGARQHWQQASDLAQSLSDERAAFAKERFAALDKRVPKLTLRAPPNAPTGLTVKRDGVEFGAAGLGIALPVEPGEHTLVVDAPGHATKTIKLELKEGEQRDVIVEVGSRLNDPATPAPTSATTPAVAAPLASTPPPTETTEPSSGRRTLAYAVGGAGIAALGVGAVFGLVAKSKNDASNADMHCTNGCDSQGTADRKSALSAARGSTIAFVIGGAALATGVVLFVTAPSSRPAAAAKLEAAVQPGGGSLLLKGSFW